jgi:hypothetical protein
MGPKGPGYAGFSPIMTSLLVDAANHRLPGSSETRLGA